MEKFRYQVKDEYGLHASPASDLVKLAGMLDSRVFIKKGEGKADGRRLFELMGLGVRRGDEITVIIKGGDERSAREKLEQFCKEHF